MAGPVTLEEFTGLNLTSGSPNYAPTVLANSQFIGVPSGGVPGPTVPATFPPNPTPLPNTGALDLFDSTGTVHYLTVQPTNPLLWPPLFSVVSQQQIVHKLHFNLLLLYTPPGQPQGVTPPVIVEQFLDLSLGTITSAIDLASDLISIQTFEGEPSPSLSATALMQLDANEAVPSIKVESTTPGSSNPPVRWTAVPDLLGSGPDDTQFVVEIDTNGTASLRFGDGTNGKQPVEGEVFTATYRVGNGTAGNVGANCLINVAAPVAAKATIQSCNNPMPAAGGIDPETAAQIVRRAPQAFMTQERAITMQDYVNVVELNPQIEDANAQTRWTGSWYTVFVAAEPQANGPMSSALRRSLTKSVNEYRLAGQAAFIEPPQYIPLTIALTICVDPDSFAMDVEKQLLQVLGSCTLPNGAPAFFAPQNFTLGESVYLSPIYAAARTVPGVTRVTATVFEPQGQNTSVYLNQGYIPMGPFQVARLDNDPSLPGNGQLKLTMQGGR
jgi:predicted phage baseplate assembly protein